jgi:hypothetical protein
VADALLLMRVSQFDLVLVGPEVTASPALPPAFRDACARLPMIELGSKFSTQHAGEAGAQLLQVIAARLNPKTV